MTTEEKMKQLKAAAKDIAKDESKMAVIAIACNEDGQLTCISGGRIDLACILAHAMRSVSGFEKVVRMAIDAYENVPYPGKDHAKSDVSVS